MKKLILSLGVITTLASCEKEEIIRTNEAGDFLGDSFFEQKLTVDSLEFSLLVGNFYATNNPDGYKLEFTEDSVYFYNADNNGASTFVNHKDTWYSFNDFVLRAEGTELHEEGVAKWIKDLREW